MTVAASPTGMAAPMQRRRFRMGRQARIEALTGFGMVQLWAAIG